MLQYDIKTRYKKSVNTLIHTLLDNHKHYFKFSEIHYK